MINVIRYKLDVRRLFLSTLLRYRSRQLLLSPVITRPISLSPHLLRSRSFKINRLFPIILCVSLFISHGISSDYAGYAGSFLRIGTSARSIAMGSGFTAELDRGFTAYHNPAGVAFLNYKQVSFAHHVLPLDRRYIATSFSTALPPTAGLGVAWVSAGVDDIDGRTSSGQHTEYLSTSEDAIYFSFAQKLQSWVSVGINVKILNQQLPMNDSKVAGKGIGFDIGVMVRPVANMTLALMIQDLNSNYQWSTGPVFDEGGGTYKDQFPTLYRIGSHYFFKGFYFVGDIGVITDHEDFLNPSLRMGTEYNYRDNYFLRAGYGNSRLSAGAGLNYSLLKQNDAFLDYAFVFEFATGIVHVFTYALNF